MKTIGGKLRRIADDVMGLMMAAMFFVFILQIVTRYLAKYQIGGSGFIWTADFTTTAMVWIVFFGGAFSLLENDHVKFDMFYQLFEPSGQRIMSIFTSIAIAVFFAWSLPATADSWLGMLVRWNKPNPTLKIPFTDVAIPMWWIYSIYAVFAVAIVTRYAVRAFRLIKGETPAQIDTPRSSEEAEAP